MRVERVHPNTYPAVESEPFRRRMHAVGLVLHSMNVRAVYLAHGSISGPDALSTLVKRTDTSTSAKQAYRCVIRRTHHVNSDGTGTYTPRFTREFAAVLNGSTRTPIPVRLFEWSSENHHLGRADGAIRLIDELTSREWEPGSRVLLWGHCHAGNVFALVTNLLAGDRQLVEQFFSAAEIYYRWPIVGCVDIPVWHRVRKLLTNHPRPLAHVSLDMVTFGTPIHYAWNATGYSRLLHFIYHRTRKERFGYRSPSPSPPKLADMLNAVDGDYVHQLGIVDTHVRPSLFAWRAWLAERRLNRFLQTKPHEHRLHEHKPHEHKPHDTVPLECFQSSMNVPDQGASLLVDYGPPEGDITTHHAGHAIYTSKKWLLFHAEEITRRFARNEVRKVA